MATLIIKQSLLMVFVMSILAGITQTTFCADIIVDSYTKAGLPAVGTSGRIARVTDDIRGLWMDEGTAWRSVLSFGIPGQNGYPSSPVEGQLYVRLDAEKGLWMYKNSQWHALNGQIVNIKEWGAKGDGTTDDTSVFNAAIALGSNTVIYVPPGDYRVNNLTVTGLNGFHIIGHDKSLSILRYNGPTGGQPPAEKSLIIWNGTTNGGIRNIQLNGNGGQCQFGLFMLAEPATGHASCSNNTFQDIEINYCARGIQFGNYSSPNVGELGRLIDPQVDSNSFINIRINFGDYGMYGDGQNIMVNTFENLSIATMTQNLIKTTSRGAWFDIKNFLGAAAGNNLCKIDHNGGFLAIDGGWEEGGTNNGFLTTSAIALYPVVIKGFNSTSTHVDESARNWSINWTGGDPDGNQGRGGLIIDGGTHADNIMISGAGSPVTIRNASFASGKGVTYGGVGADAQVIQLGSRILNNENIALSLKGGSKGKLLVLEDVTIGVRSVAPTSGTWSVGDIIFNTSPVAGGYIGWVCVSAGTPGTWKGFGNIDLSGTLVWDPPSLSNGSGSTSANITVTGASIGDYVVAAAPYDLQGIVCTGYVSATDTVKIRIQNGTGGAINLASGTWKVRVLK